EFPRIWIMALSKADLLPNLDVFKFRDLLVAKAWDDIEELLAELVQARDALAVGEGFVLVSSAKFEAGRIAVTERVGLELILPLAAMLPFERHFRWAQAKEVPVKVAENLLGGAEVLAAALIDRKMKVPGPVGSLLNFLGSNLVNDAARLAGDKPRKMNAEALAKKEYLAATLTGFRMDLDKGEEEQILLRSLR
ncbi:hypothetical protein, partial [Asanoa sp. NPDC050611]|uniref:hypothetical protein n=1 Tax=Asanoa sp. NPDC050611 TaxID=3157098 RepID=UPI0033EC8861